MGYYAGWGDRRACGTNVAPNQIKWDGFTHVNFAFATISQNLEIRKWCLVPWKLDPSLLGLTFKTI
jgi:GH18 family chitinase